MREASGQPDSSYDSSEDFAVLQRLPELAVKIGYADVYLLYGVLHRRHDALRRELEACSKPLRAFVQLFALNEPVEEAHLEAVLSASERAALIRLGVLLRNGTALSTGELTLMPILGHLAFVPTPAQNPGAYFNDDLAGLLARLYVPPRAHLRALNLHAGAGIAALIAAARGAQVVAVERVQLARACTELNVVMNGLSDRIEVIDEETFAENYAKTRFDYLFVNTPPLPFPQRLFLPPGHSPSAALELSPTAELLESLPRLLSPQGCAQIVGVDLGDAHGPAIFAPLDLIARQHKLKIVMTVSCRTALPEDSHVLDLLAWACHSLSGLSVDNARDRLLLYLEESRQHMLYLFYATASFDAVSPGLSMNRFDERGKGSWFR